jgi:transcriptional regulator NrdR family protein
LEPLLAVRSVTGTLEPFSRDKLLLSLYQSLGHRKEPVRDAGALVDTVIGQLQQRLAGSAHIESSTLKHTVQLCLLRFDKLAGKHYDATHPAT